MKGRRARECAEYGSAPSAPGEAGEGGEGGEGEGARPVPADKIRFFKEQEEKIKSINGETMFHTLPKTKIARPAEI